MPAQTTRTEYYWENGRINSQFVRRSSKYRPWPIHSRTAFLIAGIEDLGQGELKIDRGDAWRPFRGICSVLRFTRHSTNPRTPEIGSSVPENAVMAAATRSNEIMSKIGRQFRTIGIEEGMSGVLSADINETSTFQVGDWEVIVFAQTFSPEIKENVTGTDVGLIVDVRHQGKHVSKGAWMQAKVANRRGVRMKSLQDMEEQLEDIKAHTKEAYGLVFTSDGGEVFHADSPTDRMPLGALIEGMVRCTRGDRSPRLLANTVDMSMLIELIFMGP